MYSKEKILFPFKTLIKYESNMIEIYKNRTLDERVKIDDTLSFPFKSIGPIISRESDKDFYLGTATLISDNFAITAGHNLYELDFEAKEFYFAPGIKGNETLEYSKGTEFFIFDDYRKTGDSPDIAVVKLEKPLGKTFGFFNLGIYSDNTNNLNFYGYPGDKYKKANFSYELWGMDNLKTSKDIYHNIQFNCDSYSGMSGAPIFNYSDDLATIYGIFHSHRYINDKNKLGFATYFDEKMIKEINLYLNQN